MAGYTPFEFASPKSYSDWTQYAGFDRTTGDFGIPPPPEEQKRLFAEGETPSWSGLADKIIAPIKNAYGQLSNAGTSLGQGDIPGAVKALQTQPHQQPQSQPFQPIDTTPTEPVFGTKFHG